MNRIIICGKSGSGKDTLRKRMQNLGFVYAKPYTTRPRREFEHDSDYVFIDNLHFYRLADQQFFFDSQVYNEWNYGLPNFEWNTCNLFVMSPATIQKLNEDQLKSCFIIYLDIDKDTRRERILSRIGNADSVERRINADDEDFKHFTTYNLKITNADF
jgi:guanylate kinase